MGRGGDANVGDTDTGYTATLGGLAVQHGDGGAELAAGGGDGGGLGGGRVFSLQSTRLRVRIGPRLGIAEIVGCKQNNKNKYRWIPHI